MADLGYHDGYKYPHDYPGHFTEQQYLPDEVKSARIWHAQHSPVEEHLYQWMKTCWGQRFEDK
jgi:putative ATPase